MTVDAQLIAEYDTKFSMARCMSSVAGVGQAQEEQQAGQKERSFEAKVSRCHVGRIQ